MLAVALGIPAVVAVGILEKLWHWSARYAPQGDIGKWPDAVIEKECGWRDFVSMYPDKSGQVATESRLIEALVATRWIDRHDTCRLYIHDWHDHSDEAADKYLSDKGLQYALGHGTRRKQKSGQVATESRQMAPLVEISPASHTHTHTHTQTHSLSEGEGRDGSEDPEPEEEFEGVNGTYRDAFRALKATGKMNQLRYEMLAKVAQEYPLAQIQAQDNFRELVLELAGVAGSVGSALPWLRKVVSRLEQRREAEAQKKDGGGEGAKERRFVPMGGEVAT
jgi:hypothetical protein